MAYKLIAKVNGIKKVYEYPMIWGTMPEAKLYKRLAEQTQSDRRVKYYIIKFR